MPAKNPANSGGAHGEGSGVAVGPRQESSESVGAAAAAKGRDDAGAELSSAAPRSGGGIGRWRGEREANRSARDTMRAMAVHAVVPVARVAAGATEGEGNGGFCWSGLLGFWLVRRCRGFPVLHSF
jgi:hypothetical protein